MLWSRSCDLYWQRGKARGFWGVQVERDVAQHRGVLCRTARIDMLGGIEQYHDIRKEGLGFWGLLQVMGRQESDGGSAGGSSLGCLVGPHWAA